MTTKITLTDGRTLAYSEYGNPHGTPVFFIHGSPGSRLFRPPDEVTKRLGVRLICAERPGYGDSTFQPNRRILDWPDILTSCLAESLGRYLLSRGERLPDDINVRGVVPVNLRPIEKAHELGNQFRLVFLALPLGIEDPLDRLFEVRRRMTAIKHSPEAYVAFQILKGLGVAPKQIFDLIVNEFGRKATAVVTNVVGPRRPIAIAGAPMRQAMFWMPCSGRLGLGISLLSYAGEVWLGVQADVSLVPDPEKLLEGFHAEIADLTELRKQAGT